MIEGVGSLPSTGVDSTTGIGLSGLGRDAFLNLLVAQLRNQDPLSPIEPHEFAAQLATFTSVDQLAQLNAELVFQTSSIMANGELSKSAFSAALLGRTVIAEGDEVTIPEEGNAVILVDPQEAGEARLRLYDKDGNQVAERDLGSLAPGRQEVNLPSDLPSGTHRFEITLTSADGRDVPVTKYVTGVVDGISFFDGRIVLRIGAIEIPLESIADVAEGSRTTEA